MKTISKIIIAKIIFKTLIFFGVKRKIIVKRKSIKWNLDISEGKIIALKFIAQPDLNCVC